MSHGLCLTLLAILTKYEAGASQLPTIARAFGDLHYNETLTLLSQLTLISPALTVFDMDQLSRSWNTPDPICKARGECPTNPIIRLAANATDQLVIPKRSVPAVLLSGLLHGDERLGAAIVTYLIQWLVLEQVHNVYIKWLLTKRDIYSIPFANIDGYLYDQREDRGHDPNRDSPFAQDMCPRTRTGEILYKLILNKLFVSGITFHGGMRSISYAWGTPRHRIDGKSTESPDDAMMANVAAELQKSAGVFPARLPNEQYSWLDAVDANTLVPDTPYKFFYPIGPTNNIVYPVRGSVEDWAYAGGWETDEIVGCRSAGSQHLRFPFFLIETDDSKNPPASDTYGDAHQIAFPTPLAGHIPRNIRVALRLIELARPEIIFTVDVITSLMPHGPESRVREAEKAELHKALLNALLDEYELVTESDADKMNDVLSVKAFFTGCIRVQNITITIGDQVVYRDPRSYKDNELCTSLGGWSLVNHLVVYTAEIPLPARASGVVQINAEFDQHWAHQKNPDPPTKPQTHIVRSRLEPQYEVSGIKADLISAVRLFPDRTTSLGNSRKMRISLYIQSSESEKFVLNADLHLIDDSGGTASIIVRCAENDTIHCTIDCSNCTTLGEYCCPKEFQKSGGAGAYLTLRIQDVLRSRDLFRVPLVTGVYAGDIDYHGLEKPGGTKVGLWCAHDKSKTSRLTTIPMQCYNFCLLTVRQPHASHVLS